MPQPTVCVLRAPGTNCDQETAHAFDMCGARVRRVHLFRLLDRPDLLEEFQILCFPGGFSYGDDIGAGVIFASRLREQLGEAVGRFLQADKLLLGICNGFQVLLKSGILPQGATGWPPEDPSRAEATLTWNANGKFTALWVRLRVASSHNVFLRGIEEIELPIAHAEGRLVVRKETMLDEWRQNGQVALQYACGGRADSTGSINTDPKAVLPYPDNPNGSVGNIAGLGDPSGRVLGLMPHPERFIHATQHPQWTRRELQGEGAGLKLFRNACEYFC